MPSSERRRLRPRVGNKRTTFWLAGGATEDLDALERYLVHGLTQPPLIDPSTSASDVQPEAEPHSTGAGFGNADNNALVEAAAMDAVRRHYGDAWHVEDVSARKLGWDIPFTNRANLSVRCVEVKGVSGTEPVVLLTANELRAANESDSWWLAVVIRARTDPHVVEYAAADAIRLAVPYQFRVDLR